MKKVRLITNDDLNGKIAISRTPLKNKFFFGSEWHELQLQIKPEIIDQATILETTHAVFAELSDTFNISNLIERVEVEMWDNKRHPRPATIDRRLRELRGLGLINYDVINSGKGIYRKIAITNDIEERFIEFLKKKGAFINFKENLLNPEIRSLGKAETISGYLQRIGLKARHEYITMAFLWRASLQGKNYWSKIDTKWGKICESI